MVHEKRDDLYVRDIRKKQRSRETKYIVFPSTADTTTAKMN